MEKFSFKNSTVELIKEEFIRVHGEKYRYDSFIKYEGAEKLINIICEIHGNFRQSPYLHAKGHGCGKCSRDGYINKYYNMHKESFILKFNLKFNNRLSITGIYKNNSTRISYLCNKCCNSYENTPNKLLAKGNVGCAYCYGNGKNKQTLEYFEKYKELLIGDKGYIYIVRLYDEVENFIKVGITKEESCVNRMQKIPYNKEIIYLGENNMYNCFKIEQIVLKENKKVMYKPYIYFGGLTECLKLESLNGVENHVRLLMAESFGQI